MTSLATYEADPAFEDGVRTRMESIESALAEAAVASTSFVTDAASHIINAGGKRFRPLLVVLASQLYPGADPARVDTAAIVMELTHVASMYHDDVMDDADRRRQRGWRLGARKLDQPAIVTTQDEYHPKNFSCAAPAPRPPDA